jgi:hypothetical protein
MVSRAPAGEVSLSVGILREDPEAWHELHSSLTPGQRFLTSRYWTIAVKRGEEAEEPDAYRGISQAIGSVVTGNCCKFAESKSVGVQMRDGAPNGVSADTNQPGSVYYLTLTAPEFPPFLNAEGLVDAIMAQTNVDLAALRLPCQFPLHPEQVPGAPAAE